MEDEKLCKSFWKMDMDSDCLKDIFITFIDNKDEFYKIIDNSKIAKMMQDAGLFNLKYPYLEDKDLNKIGVFYSNLPDKYTYLIKYCTNDEVIENILNNNKLRKIIFNKDELEKAKNNDSKDYLSCYDALLDNPDIVKDLKKDELYMLNYLEIYDKAKFKNIIQNAFNFNDKDLETIINIYYNSFNNKDILVSALEREKTDIFINIFNNMYKYYNDVKKIDSILKVIKFYPDFAINMLNKNLNNEEKELLDMLFLLPKIKGNITNIDDLKKLNFSSLEYDREESRSSLSMFDCSPNGGFYVNISYPDRKGFYCFNKNGKIEYKTANSHPEILESLGMKETDSMSDFLLNLSKNGLLSMIFEGSVSLVFLPSFISLEQFNSFTKTIDEDVLENKIDKLEFFVAQCLEEENNLEEDTFDFSVERDKNGKIIPVKRDEITGQYPINYQELVKYIKSMNNIRRKL